MGVLKIKSRHVLLERTLEQRQANLLESVHSSINVAKEQTIRSLEIVARSREIVDRTRNALAKANRIQLGIVGEASRNPVIEPRSQMMHVDNRALTE